MTTVPIDTKLISTPDDIEDAGLRDLYVLWKDAHKGPVAPSDLDFLDFPDLLPWCIKLRLNHGQCIDMAMISYYGNQLATVLGRDETGVLLSELDRYPLGQKLIRQCGELGSAVLAGPARIPLEGREFLVFEHICLPLFKDETTLSGFLFASHPHNT